MQCNNLYITKLYQTRIQYQISYKIRYTNQHIKGVLKREALVMDRIMGLFYLDLVNLVDQMTF